MDKAQLGKWAPACHCFYFLNFSGSWTSFSYPDAMVVTALVWVTRIGRNALAREGWVTRSWSEVALERVLLPSPEARDPTGTKRELSPNLSLCSQEVLNGV